MDIEVHEISAFGGDDANMLAPMSAFMVKGWSRTLGMVACLLHAYADEDVLQARSCSHNKRYVFFLCQWLWVLSLPWVCNWLVALKAWPDDVKEFLVNKLVNSQLKFLLNRIMSMSYTEWSGNATLNGEFMIQMRWLSFNITCCTEELRHCLLHKSRLRWHRSTRWSKQVWLGFKVLDLHSFIEILTWQVSRSDVKVSLSNHLKSIFVSNEPANTFSVIFVFSSIKVSWQTWDCLKSHCHVTWMFKWLVFVSSTSSLNSGGEDYQFPKKNVRVGLRPLFFLCQAFSPC